MKRTHLLAVSLLSATVISSQAALIGYWNLDGDFNDSSGNGNTGTLFGGASYSASVPAALGAGSSVAFDGAAGTYGSINHGTGLAVTTLPTYTVSMWVNGDAALAGNDNVDDRIFSEGMTTNENPLFNVGTRNNTNAPRGVVDIYIRNGQGAQTLGHVYSPGIAFDGNWHHLVFSGGTDGMLDLYIDGVYDTTFDYSNVPAFSPDTTTIGGILRSADCCNFTGNIDDIAMWDRDLNPTEIGLLSTGTSPTVIPEPSTGILALLGATLLFRRRR
jgi:hypothetical protein